MDYGPDWLADVQRARRRREAAFIAAARRRSRWHTAASIARDVVLRTLALTAGALALARLAGWVG